MNSSLSTVALWGCSTVTAWCLLGSCSLVLDLPADCVIDECNGYQCNPAGTGCLGECDSDNDCAPGALCNESARACVFIGCTADSDDLTPWFEGVGNLRDVAAVWNGAELGAAFVTGEGSLVFQRFGLDGEALSSPVVLDDDEAQPARPSLVWTGDVWGISWEAVGPIEDVQRELLRMAVVGRGDRLDLEPKTLWNTTEDLVTGIVEKSVDDVSLVYDRQRDRFAVFWATRTNAANILMMIVERDGRDLDGNDEIPHEAASVVTFSQANSAAPSAVFRGADVYDVAFREEGAGSVSLVLRTVDLEGNRQGTDVNVSQSEGQVSSHDVASISTGLAFGFTVDGAGSQSFRAQLRDDRTFAGSGKLLIDRDFEATADGVVVSRLDGAEYAVVMVAERLQRREVFMARFKDNGASVGVPFSLTELLTREPITPLVAPTTDGYLVLHLENDGDNAGSILGRHWTCDPP